MSLNNTTNLFNFHDHNHQKENFYLTLWTGQENISEGQKSGSISDVAPVSLYFSFKYTTKLVLKFSESGNAYTLHYHYSRYGLFSHRSKICTGKFWPWEINAFDSAFIYDFLTIQARLLIMNLSSIQLSPSSVSIQLHDGFLTRNSNISTVTNVLKITLAPRYSEQNRASKNFCCHEKLPPWEKKQQQHVNSVTRLMDPLLSYFLQPIEPIPHLTKLYLLWSQSYLSFYHFTPETWTGAINPIG